jgi:GTP-binding protein Era
MNDQIKKSGYVALIGKPNVGKSTLMNHLLGKKISITSRKPQTTRHRIVGVKTVGDTQIVFVDTPGLHLQQKHLMNKVMNRVARTVLDEVDIILFLVEAMVFDEEDAAVLRHIKKLSTPVFLVVTKIDKVKDKKLILPFIEKLSKEHQFKNIIPVSAKQNQQVDALESIIIESLPEDMAYYPPEQFTDRSLQFIATEFIREKLMRYTGDELPYETAVTIEAVEETDEILKIAALIWVNKESQKSIVIGTSGAGLKRVGTEARLDLEKYVEKKVLLKLWVKVKSGWSDDARSLQQFGYDEE